MAVCAHYRVPRGRRTILGTDLSHLLLLPLMMTFTSCRVLNSSQRLATAHTRLGSVFPQLPEPIGRLLTAAYAAYGGPEGMSLSQWRDLEQELKQKLKRKRKCRPSRDCLSKPSKRNFTTGTI